jgi:DNA-binding transcriptional LysR family regulator
VLPSVLRVFRAEYPAVEVSLVERLPAQQAAGLAARRLDVGIGPPPSPGEIESFLIVEEPLVAALPAGHRLAADAEVELAALASDPWVLLPARLRSPLRATVVAACAAAGITPQVHQVARQLDAVVALVSAGLGVTLVPRSAERVSREGVIFRPLRGVDTQFRLAAAWHGTDASPTAVSFLAVLRREIPKVGG